MASESHSVGNIVPQLETTSTPCISAIGCDVHTFVLLQQDEHRPAKRRALNPTSKKDKIVASSHGRAYNRIHLLEDAKRKFPDMLPDCQLQKRARRHKSASSSHENVDRLRFRSKQPPVISRQTFFKKFADGSSYEGEWLPCLEKSTLKCLAGHPLVHSDGSCKSYKCSLCELRGLNGARMSCTSPCCNFDVCNLCAFRTGKMGVMDGFGIFKWPSGRCFEGIFAANLPVSGHLVELAGDVYSVRYAGDKTLADGVEPIFRRLTSFYQALNIDLSNIISIPRLVEVAPVEAYTGHHSGLLQNAAQTSKLMKGFYTSTAAVPEVIHRCLNRSHMYAFFLSQEGIANRETKSLKEKIMDLFSKPAQENQLNAVIASASDALSQICLDQTPSHMDLLLELLCSLLVSDPNGAAAQTTLNVLHRFLMPLQPGKLASLPLNSKEKAECAIPFSERQLDRYTEMLEDLLSRGSATTQQTATDCLLRIATARGGLRHVSRAATFLEKTGLSMPLVAVTSVKKLVDGVECILESDVKRATLKDSLHSLLAAAWAKYAPHIRMSTLPHRSMKALKMLVFGVFRLIAER